MYSPPEETWSSIDEEEARKLVSATSGSLIRPLPVGEGLRERNRRKQEELRKHISLRKQFAMQREAGKLINFS